MFCEREKVAVLNNLLKLNDDKTELIVLGTRLQLEMTPFQQYLQLEI